MSRRNVKRPDRSFHRPGSAIVINWVSHFSCEGACGDAGRWNAACSSSYLHATRRSHRRGDWGRSSRSSDVLHELNSPGPGGPGPRRRAMRWSSCVSKILSPVEGGTDGSSTQRRRSRRRRHRAGSGWPAQRRWAVQRRCALRAAAVARERRLLLGGRDVGRSGQTLPDEDRREKLCGAPHMRRAPRPTRLACASAAYGLCWRRTLDRGIDYATRPEIQRRGGDRPRRRTCAPVGA